MNHASELAGYEKMFQISINVLTRSFRLSILQPNMFQTFRNKDVPFDCFLYFATTITTQVITLYLMHNTSLETRLWWYKEPVGRKWTLNYDQHSCLEDTEVTIIVFRPDSENFIALEYLAVAMTSVLRFSRWDPGILCRDNTKKINVRSPYKDYTTLYYRPKFLAITPPAGGFRHIVQETKMPIVIW